MYEKTVERFLSMLKYAPYDHKIRKMCERALEREPYAFQFVPYQYKTQQVCEKVNKIVLDWLVKPIMTIKNTRHGKTRQIKSHYLWHGNHCRC